MEVLDDENDNVIVQNSVVVFDDGFVSRKEMRNDDSMVKVLKLGRKWNEVMV